MNSHQVNKAITFVRLSARKKQTQGLSKEDKERLYQVLASVGEAFPYDPINTPRHKVNFECKESRKYDWIKSKVYDLLGI